MRWILLALLTANIGYFIWHQWRPETGSSRVNAEAGRASVPIPQAGLRPLLMASEAGLDGARVVRAAPELDASPGNGSSSPLPPGKESPASQTDNEPERDLAVLEPGSPVPDASSRPGAGPATPYRLLGQAASSGCIELGPMESGTRVARLVGELTDNELEPDIERRDEVTRTVYWVHIPPAPTQQEALEVLRKIRARGIDSFLIEKVDEIRNGISLGVFNEYESAVRHRETMGRKGLNAEIFADPKLNSRYYLTLRGPFSGADVSVIASAINRELTGEAEWTVRACGGIASLDGIE